MSSRVALVMAVGCAVCVASPLAAAETPDSTRAGLRPAQPPSAAQPATAAAPEAALRPVPLAVPDDHPRRYSLHRDYGEQPDATVLPPEFFLQSTPVSTDPQADAPQQRDRHGRTGDTTSPDSPSA